MTFTKKHFQKLVGALSSARRSAGSPVLGNEWTADLMRRVRKIGHLQTRQAFLELFQRFAWRLAPVAMTLIIVLTLAVSQMDVISDYELAKTVMDDPADISLMALITP